MLSQHLGITVAEAFDLIDAHARSAQGQQRLYSMHLQCDGGRLVYIEPGPDFDSHYDSQTIDEFVVQTTTLGSDIQRTKRSVRKVDLPALLSEIAPHCSGMTISIAGAAFGVTLDAQGRVSSTTDG